jgi:hypothetical protein
MINKFEVTGLNGEFDFCLNFQPDLNLLTGKNGVGKTTVLKLIYYIISGNFERLIPEIPFESARIIANGFEVQIGISGKLLYEIIVRFTHAPNRYPRRYSYGTLMELSVVYGLRGPLMSKIMDAVRLKLGFSGGPQMTLGV